MVINMTKCREIVIFNGEEIAYSIGQKDGANRADRVANAASMWENSPEVRAMEKQSNWVQVDGKEFGDVDLGSKDGKKKFVIDVEAWYKNNLQGKSETNSVLGDIHFTGIGKNELRSNTRGLDKLFLVPYLCDLIRTSTDVEQNVPLRNDKKTEKFLKKGWKIHYINNDFVKESTPYRVKITIVEDGYGNKFYALGNVKAAPGIPGPGAVESAKPPGSNAAFSKNVPDKGLSVKEKVNDGRKSTRPRAADISQTLSIRPGKIQGVSVYSTTST